MLLYLYDKIQSLIKNNNSNIKLYAFVSIVDETLFHSFLIRNSTIGRKNDDLIYKYSINK